MLNARGAIIIEGHVQGLANTRSLGEAGIPVFVVDQHDCIARYSKYCKQFFKCPSYLEDSFAFFLIKLANDFKLKDWVLIPSNDHAVYTISKHKLILEDYYKVITPVVNIIEKIYDKKRLLSIANECGVPIPKTVYLKSWDDSVIETIKFPVITKGRNGLSFYKSIRKKALLAENINQLRLDLRVIAEKFDLGKTFTQELIPFDGTNKTISFTAFCDQGLIKTYWMGVKLREHPLQFGTATFAQSIYIEDCYKQSVLLLKTLNYTGVCEVEYLFDPRDSLYKLIEVNARTWLWVGLAKACGVDYAKMIYYYLSGSQQNFPSHYKLGVKWINPISDTTFSLIAIIKGKLRIRVYLSSIFKGEIINALFSRRDWKPFFAYLIGVIGFIRTR